MLVPLLAKEVVVMQKETAASKNLPSFLVIIISNTTITFSSLLVFVNLLIA